MSEQPRLTKLVKSAGCAAKLPPDVLRKATVGLVGTTDPRLLVGFEWADDAGIVALDAERALVQTVDFFTPIVDDAYEFGAISATNALSDVYAMGGEPLSCLNIVGFPDGLDPDILHRVLQGGLDVIRDAGALLAGGHSVRDPELKYGVAVTGLVHPDRVWKNGGALPGDALVLTKPIGTGILTTARKRDAIEADALLPAIRSMRTLNRDAKRIGEKYTVHACTDITGNSLAGHLWEMARASSCELVLQGPAIPLFPRVRELAAAGNCPGGTKNNAAYVGDQLILDGGDETTKNIVLDPQTSGGLVFAVPADQGDALLAELRAAGLLAARIGTARAGDFAVRVVGDIG